MAIWFWGNGEKLRRGEKEVVKKAFHEPLRAFMKGEEMDWGSRHPLQIRTLKSDGSVSIEEDTRLEDGLLLWNALKKVGATGHLRLSKL
jgi:hypothetical protein